MEVGYFSSEFDDEMMMLALMNQSLLADEEALDELAFHYMMMVQLAMADVDGLPKLTGTDQRFPMDKLKRVTKPDTECKDGSDTENDDEDDDDAEEPDDDDAGDEDFSGEEGGDDDEDDPEADPEANGNEGSDDDDDDDDEEDDDDDEDGDEDEEEDDEDEEEQPPAKKRK